MPPRIALSRTALRTLNPELYICPSCQISRPTRRKAIKSSTTSRHNTTITSKPPTRRSYATTEHLTSNTALPTLSIIPPSLRTLHTSLQNLLATATPYLSTSRLDLALRTLESPTPTTRIALLGLGPRGLRTAKKLARVLCADQSGQEEEWERWLVEESSETGLVLRYGDYVANTGVLGSEGPIRVVGVPAEWLRVNRLEIFIGEMGVRGFESGSGKSGREGLEDAVLVPLVTIPNSRDGRVGFVRFPVHKTVVVGEGVEGAVKFGRLVPVLGDSKVVGSALNVKLSGVEEEVGQEELATGNAVDIDLAMYALATFRANKGEETPFRMNWETSRIWSIQKWLITPEPAENRSRLHQSEQLLLDSILKHAETAITVDQAEAQASIDKTTIKDDTRSKLAQSLSKWSEDAHIDLQRNLNTALDLPTWHRTAWWRLLWRIDEVSMSASDVLRRGWLVEAEQSLAFLSGRLLEAGVTTADELRLSTPLNPTPDSLTIPTTTSTTDQPTLIQSTITPTAILPLPTPTYANIPPHLPLNPTFHPPWPSTITSTRQTLLSTTVPTLHATAQRLLLTALTTLSTSTAAGIWLYAASAGTAGYEAGAIAALGCVWGTRRLQVRWGRERDGWVESVREEGRRVLGDVETRLGKMVGEGGRRTVEVGRVREVEMAREAVRGVRREMEALGGKA